MNIASNEFWAEKGRMGANKQVTEPEILDTSSDGRYIQYNEILGRGAFKTVYKGFDEIDGIEVAWNQIDIADVLESPAHCGRLHSEVNLLGSLKHENIVRSFGWWVDPKNKTMNMITELFTSGSLRQYRKKHKCVDIKAIKNWARQILRGLHYLHTHNPRIIHRDIKCDNIFVNGNYGEVKIGDLGFATVMQQPTARSVIGTPEFMAPELYDEEYNELVDIYSFGMCMLELITCQYPYSECKNPAQIFKRVTSGIKPAALGEIQDPEVRCFIEKCLVPASERLSAAELLNDPFLLPGHPNNYSCVHPQISEFTTNHLNSALNAMMEVEPSYKKLSGSSYTESTVENPVPALEIHRCNELNKFVLKGEKHDDSSLSLTLQIVSYAGNNDAACQETVHFLFYINEDTTLSIAEEMVIYLRLPGNDAALIAEMIDSLVSQLLFCCGTSSGSLNGTKSFQGSAMVQNENLLGSNAIRNYSHWHRNRESNERSMCPELPVSKNNCAIESIGALPQYIDASSSDAMCKKDLQLADYARMSYGPSLMTKSMKKLEDSSSSAGSWTTASSSVMNPSSSTSLTDEENEIINEFKAKTELETVDMQY
ncbi:probable serine/threonine-protein kinase WNK10 [Andrographis paniculata]|uniref:probable serine/threonine-protein kinase WNK10 n=1 Tax=Andrographis paniculata TaxID=175694 RepID=UPI0021E7D32A|nr:probable serine/threonine-protein kinase WNK10 [Andrographis paniculata]